MYKCKECGAEYENKPDYCDCGNDEFEIIELAPSKKDNSPKNVEQKVYAENVENKTQINNELSSKNNAYNIQNSSTNLFKDSVEPYSVVIFILCLLLSAYIIFFAWNYKQIDTDKKVDFENSKAEQNIPANIEKIWNNTPPKIENKITEDISKQKEIKQVINELPSQQVQENKPKTTRVILQKQTPKIQIQKTQTPKSTTKSSVAQKVNTQKTDVKIAEQQKKAAEEAAKKQALAEQERKKAEELQIKKLQAEQAKKAKELKEQQEAAAKQALKTYKNNLRNTIAKKIDFTRVIGDGSCTVSFRIDSSGKLINRSFSKQSSNNTLNDAVYEAMMSTPTFNVPPSGYKNELLNLNIKFYNGNFEIFIN